VAVVNHDLEARSGRTVQHCILPLELTTEGFTINKWTPIAMKESLWVRMHLFTELRK
jgi:hypothetical protein